MDPEDDSTAYLKYLNDPTNGYLLNSNEVELNEPIFTEIGAGDWSTEGFPVLLSGPLIAENEESPGNVSMDSLVENGNITSEDVLYSLSQEIDGENSNVDTNVLQILNSDGSLTTINKSELNLPEPSTNDEVFDPKLLEEYTMTVVAQKCKLCGFLCETSDELYAHFKGIHAELFQEAIIGNGSKTYRVKYVRKMTSLLSGNEKNKELKTVFMCSVCNNVFKDKNDLKEHMISDHNLKPNVENQEPEAGTSTAAKKPAQSLRYLASALIKEQQKALSKIKCTVKGCKQRFPRDDLRELHEKLHVENKNQYRCTECSEVFSIWRICANHMWKLHKIDFGLLVCPMCNKFKSNNHIHVLNHMLTHNEERPFLCVYCGKGYKQLAQLRNHEVSHKPPENLPNWSTMRQCNICEQFFANSKTMKKHMQIVHEKFKPFICNICGHKTARKAMLELHLRQHTRFKPHKCQHCSYETGDPNCLRRHLMRHVGDTKYSCPHCVYSCIQSITYKRHLQMKHPDETGIFHCTYDDCNYSSVNATTYAAHLKYHEINENDLRNALGKDAENQQNSKSGSGSINNPHDLTGTKADIEDDEIQNCYLNADQTEDTVDTGGITIPAGLEEMHLVHS